MLLSLFKIDRQIYPLRRLYRRPPHHLLPALMGKRNSRSTESSEIELQSVEQNKRVVRRARQSVTPSVADSETENIVPVVTETKPKQRKAAEKEPPGVVFHDGLRPPPTEEAALRMVSWNVAGLRALLKKDPTALHNLTEATGCDVLCLQEHKLQCQHVEEVTEKLGLPGWWSEWTCSTITKGYSGVSILSRKPPLKAVAGIGNTAHDAEGRVLTAEFDDFYVVNVYVPNAGEGLKRLDYRTMQWDIDFSNYVKGLEASKPVMVAGDLNCAHKAIDIHNPKTNLRSPGFTQEERDSFTANFMEQGFVDCFRQLYPDVIGYTYWTYKFNARKNNKGWRLDYFLASSSLASCVHDCYPLSAVSGSDHCPLVAVVKTGTTQGNNNMG